jgi:pimeloyl-ACP methyl ester carboxylesterase
LARPWLFRVRPPNLLLDRYIFAPSTPVAFEKKIRENLRRVSPEVLAGRVQELLNCDARRELARIKIPMLHMQGANDVLVKSRCFEEMRAFQPNIHLVTIPAPHLVLQSQPSKSAEIILKFCSSIPH